MPEGTANAPAGASPPESPTSAAPQPLPRRRKSRLPYFIVGALTLCVIAGLAACLVAYLKTVDKLSSALENMTRIAPEFATEHITQTFIHRQLAAASTGGAVLEVATAEADETFSRTSTLSLWNQPLPLGTTVSEITVPVTYRYHVNLNDSWSLSANGDHCLVVAPSIRPSLPVAIDTGKMRKKTRSGWGRFDKGENLEELEQSLTPQLAERARTALDQPDLREKSRHAVGEFVKNWLMREGHWQPERFTRITVLFPDETGAAGNAAGESSAGPTIEYRASPNPS